ncbi:hypothetical protein MCOR29_000654 [Pyricularia oryzae]|nr:hypothetical protein MCOR29_000654 [Pyricularia oryzae]KAI6342575.1 hypothetical protein MCOR30_001819 [Pyricularia oryzae]KAI6372630.1 hypothetical protein MCOR31_003621 [Pyricularia oryzae]KAI6407816.1 hypothetical protein MCOR23_001651 [Pyricularia oryzae]KAI6444567.1 hypothetical protein MCOR22_004784 [Pyricularia oryzae]
MTRLFDISAGPYVSRVRIKQEEKGGRREWRATWAVTPSGEGGRTEKAGEKMCGEKDGGAPTGTPCWLSIHFAGRRCCRRQIGPGRPHLTRIGIEQYNCGEGQRAKKNSGTSVLDGLSKDVAVFDTFSSP